MNLIAKLSKRNRLALALILSFILFAGAAKAQVTIWSEDFESYADGATVAVDNNTANPAVDWSHDGGATVNKVFATNPITGTRSFFHRNGNSTWTTEAIDISGHSNISISINLNELTCEAGDKIETFYDIDAAGPVEFGDGNGDGAFNNATNSVSSLNGSSMVITVVTTSDNGNDKHKFDDIIVQGTLVLPIELVYFSAKAKRRHVVLEWQTASEIHNDYFTIERSIDALEWDVVREVQGAGNSASHLNYKAIDKKPYPGISYYRLKQTDFDGQYEYSDIVSVQVKLTNPKISSYPNPTRDQITLEGDKLELQQVRIFSKLGLDVTSLTRMLDNLDTKSTLDLSGLDPGMYYIKTRNTTTVVYKQ